MNPLAEKKIRHIVRQELNKHKGLKETDLVASDRSDWESKKSEFRNFVSNLLNNIEADDYDDAEGQIEKTISILSAWKKRIAKGLSDSNSNIN